MKLTLDMMQSCGVTYSWNTIYIALTTNLMVVDELQEYAIEIMNHDNYTDNAFIKALAWGKLEKEEIVSFIEAEGYITSIESVRENELKKIKYAMLIWVKRNYQSSEEELIKKISEIYADFNFPEDMAGLIYYMPVQD